MSFDTLSRLAELSDTETIPAFNADLEEPIVSLLFDFPQFVQVGLIKPEFFASLPCRWVVAGILNYHEEYGVVPSRTVLKTQVEKQITEDDPYDDVFRIIKRKSDPREVDYVRLTLKEWLRDRAYGQIYSDAAVEAFHQGNYEQIEDIVQRAARIYSFDQGEVFGFVDAVDFLEQTYDYDWLVEGVLVARQSMLLGGKKKCLKTAILCDLAISLATGTEFLGHFKVPRPRRVAFFSAESGEQDIQHRLATIKKQKGGKLERGYLYPSFTRPQLSSDEDLAKIRDFTGRQKIEVVIVDPLYLTLLAGGDRQTAASDLYQMGRVFGDVADTIIKAGATPVLSHHFKKTIEGDELDLDDFSMVGAAEFARQSLLIARRGEYTGPRNNLLVVRTHGYGRGDRYSVRVDEGTLDAPLWAVAVEQERETVARANKTRAGRAVGELLAAMASLMGEKQSAGVMKEELKKELGWSGARVSKVLGTAMEEGQVRIVQGGGRALFQPAAPAPDGTDGRTDAP